MSNKRPYLDLGLLIIKNKIKIIIIIIIIKIIIYSYYCVTI